MSKQTFILESVSSTNTKKKIQRRTLEGQIKAVTSGKFEATGKILDERGKPGERLEGVGYNALKQKGISNIYIQGLKRMSIAIQ